MTVYAKFSVRMADFGRTRSPPITNSERRLFRGRGVKGFKMFVWLSQTLDRVEKKPKHQVANERTGGSTDRGVGGESAKSTREV